MTYQLIINKETGEDVMLEKEYNTAIFFIGEHPGKYRLKPVTDQEAEQIR